MAKLSRLAGSTSHILTLFVQDSSSTTGAGLAGLTFSSAGLTCYFKRNTGTASVAVTLATVTTLGTYAAGGFKEIDSANMPGFYEFHPPDAAYASNAKSVAFLLKGATNMAPVPIEVELTAVDNQAAANFGMTNLDAAVSSRSTYAGGAVASVTAPVTAGAVTDKTGYSLAAAGLDAVPVETGVNARQALSPILAACAGGLSGAGTGTIVIKGGNVATTRITAATDAFGNRSAVTLAVPA
jgi:hypothetical protein